MNINFIKTRKDAITPSRATQGSAGYDLYACIDEDIAINAGEIAVIDTGVAIEIPEEMFGMICPRSGLAAKHGISVLNSPGIIDSDYRGELKCILINSSKTRFTIENKMRIAQLIIAQYNKIIWIESDRIADSERGIGGIGSTGLK
jgi:dUTP pyrophosphatase